MIAILLISHPFKVFRPIVGLDAVRVVDGYFPSAVVSGRRRKKGKGHDCMDEQGIGDEIVFQNDLEIASSDKMRSCRLFLAPSAYGVRSSNALDLSNVADIKRQDNVSDDDAPPFDGSIHRANDRGYFYQGQYLALREN